MGSVERRHWLSAAANRRRSRWERMNGQAERFSRSGPRVCAGDIRADLLGSLQASIHSCGETIRVKISRRDHLRAKGGNIRARRGGMEEGGKMRRKQDGEHRSPCWFNSSFRASLSPPLLTATQGDIVRRWGFKDGRRGVGGPGQVEFTYHSAGAPPRFHRTHRWDV